MNILYIVHPSEAGNSTSLNHIRGVAQGLEGLGHTVHLAGADFAQGEKKKPPRQWCPRWFTGEATLLYLLWVELKLLATRGNLPRDAIYARHRWLNLLELLSPRPFVREVNGFVADELKLRKAGSGFSIWLFDKIEHWNLRRGSWWVPVCPEMADTLVKEYGVPREKITVVSNAANTDLFSPRPEIEASNSICFVGQLWVHQNLDKVMRAMPLLDTTLLIIGEGEIRAELEAIAPQNVEFLGRLPQEQIPEVIASCALCVGPFFQGEYSEKIGRSGLKMYEYLACGKPVVCSRSDNSQPIEDNGMGVLVDDLEPETIAGAITLLLRNPELRALMGRRARKYAVEHGSWQRAAEKIAAVLGQARK